MPAGLFSLVVDLVGWLAGVDFAELLLKVLRSEGFEVRTDLFLGLAVGLFFGLTEVFQLLDEDTIVVIVFGAFRVRRGLARGM